MDSLAYWNLRAETFGGMNAKAHDGKPKQGGYMPRFISLLSLEEGQSVFDMGCATGTLALPLARAGHDVCARDFSPRMIERLREACEAEGLPIDAAVMAWEDDWEACGIAPNSYDVAVASRSLPVKRSEMEKAIAALDRVARTKVVVTVSATLAPAYDARLLAFMGRETPVPKGHVRVIDVLAEMGRLPELTYIPFERPMRFNDKEMAWLELRKLGGGEPFDDREEALFQQYATDHFLMNEDEGETVYQLDYRLDVSWAFISWEVGE